MMQHNLAVDILGVLRPPETGPYGVALPAPADAVEFRDMLAERFQPAQETAGRDLAGEDKGKATAEVVPDSLPVLEPREMPEYTALGLQPLIALQVTPELVGGKPNVALAAAAAIGGGDTVTASALDATLELAGTVRLSAQSINISPGAELSIDLSGELYAERVTAAMALKVSAASVAATAQVDPQVRQEVAAAVLEALPVGEQTLAVRELIPAPQHLALKLAGSEPRELTAQLAASLPQTEEIIFPGQQPQLEPTVGRQTPEMLARAENGAAKPSGLSVADNSGVPQAKIAAENNVGQSVVNSPLAQERAVERLLQSLAVEAVEVKTTAQESAPLPAQRLRADSLPSSPVMPRDIPPETPVRLDAVASRQGNPRGEVSQSPGSVIKGETSLPVDQRGGVFAEQAKTLEIPAENAVKDTEVGAPVAKTTPGPAKEVGVAPVREDAALPTRTAAVKPAAVAARASVSEPAVLKTVAPGISSGLKVVAVDGSKPLTSTDIRPVAAGITETVAAPLNIEPVLNNLNNVAQENSITQPLQGKSVPELAAMGVVGEETPLAVSRTLESARTVTAPELVLPPVIDVKQVKPVAAQPGELVGDTAAIADKGDTAGKLAAAPVAQVTPEANIGQQAGRETSQDPARGQVSAREPELADFKATQRPENVNLQEIPPAAQVLEGRSNPIEGLVFNKIPQSLALADRETMLLGPTLVRRLSEVIVDGVRKEYTQIRLQLNPPSLGKLNILLRVEEGQLMAHLQVSSQDVKAALVSHLADLQASLQEQDVNLTRFTVDVAADFGAAQSQADPGRERRQAGTISAGLPHDAATEAPELLDRVKMGINAVDLLA